MPAMWVKSPAGGRGWGHLGRPTVCAAPKGVFFYVWKLHCKGRKLGLLRWKEGKKNAKIDFSKIMFFYTLKYARHHCEIRNIKRNSGMSQFDI